MNKLHVEGEIGASTSLNSIEAITSSSSAIDNPTNNGECNIGSSDISPSNIDVTKLLPTTDASSDPSDYDSNHREITDDVTESSAPGNGGSRIRSRQITISETDGDNYCHYDEEFLDPEIYAANANAQLESDKEGFIVPDTDEDFTYFVSTSYINWKKNIENV